MTLLLFSWCVWSSLSDLRSWWSPPLWVILGHHERLGSRLSKGNGLFCNIPALLPAEWLQLPLNGNYHCFCSLEDLSFSRRTIFVFSSPPPSHFLKTRRRAESSDALREARRWRTTRTAGWRTPWRRPTTTESLAARSKNCAPLWNWEAQRR